MIWLNFLLNRRRSQTFWPSDLLGQKLQSLRDVLTQF